MEKYGFVYIWYDRKHKRYYIGCHWGAENDGYICSSSNMKSAYNRRPQDFKRKILSRIYTDKKTLLEEEYNWLKQIKQSELGIKYYNLHNYHFNHWSSNTQTAKTLSERISKKTKEAMYRPEVREKYLNGLKTRNTRSSDPEVREKRRISMIGKNVGKDNSKAVAASAELRRGKSLSEEHKQKVKDAGVFKELNSKKIKCLYCDFEGNVGNIGRYHNEKCKHKPK